MLPVFPMLSHPWRAFTGLNCPRCILRQFLFCRLRPTGCFGPTYQHFCICSKTWLMGFDFSSRGPWVHRGTTVMGPEFSKTFPFPAIDKTSPQIGTCFFLDIVLHSALRFSTGCGRSWSITHIHVVRYSHTHRIDYSFCLAM